VRYPPAETPYFYFMSASRLTIPLMATSMTLLLVLQTFWLRSVYHDERRDLERDVSILFGNTIFDMSDSLVEKSIRALPPRDSLDRNIKIDRRVIGDSMIIGKTFEQRTYRDSTKSLQVFLYSSRDRDSVKHYLRPLIDHVRQRPRAQAFTIRLTGDSLKVADIRKKFDGVLTRAGIVLPGGAIKIMSVPPSLKSEKKKRDAIFTPTGAYSAEFVNINWIILKKITPQMAFAFLLTLITSASFFVMFRNLKAQQKLMAQKNDFISNVTHELKTPIATVSVALEALKNFKGIENPKLTAEYLDIARHELQRLAVLTDKVLATSLFDEHGMLMEMERVDVEAILEGALFAMRPVIEKHNGTVRIEKKGSDFSLCGNSVHLTNVVHNLLDNAVKYSPQSPDITVSLADDGDHVSFSVSDRGQGIPAEYHDKIFEKFFRMPTGDVHNVKGYGLGLSYVAGVVKNHGGKITVGSEPGRGSTFHIAIPRQNV
jgi:two-component system phosphate regulon sensor histidine kinase PhoR